MVAKCANPACDSEFQELSKGRLFLLPPPETSFVSWSRGKLSDNCFWLCPECVPTHTITRRDSGIVVSARDPKLLGEVLTAQRRGAGTRLRSKTETA